MSSDSISIFDDTAPNCVVSYYPSSPNFFALFSIEVVHPKACMQYNADSDTYTNNGVNVSEPAKLPNYTSMYLGEVALFAYLTVFAFYAFLLCTNYRSCSRINTDWFRLMAGYMIATALLIVLFNVPWTTNCGAHRNVVLGADIHLAAELVIILYIWFGNVYLSQRNVQHIVYLLAFLFVLTLLLLFIPVNYALFIGLAYGFTIDYTLMFSLLYVSHLFTMSHTPYQSRTFRIGAIAVVLHNIASLAIAGYLAQSLYLYVIGILFIVPTHFLFTWFAIRYHQRVVFCSSQFTANEILSFAIYKHSYSNQANSKKRDHEEQETDNQNELEVGPEAAGHLIATSVPSTFGHELEDEVTRSTDDLFYHGALQYFHLNRSALCKVVALSVLCGFAELLLIWMSPCFLPKQLMCTCF